MFYLERASTANLMLLCTNVVNLFIVLLSPSKAIRKTVTAIRFKLLQLGPQQNSKLFIIYVKAIKATVQTFRQVSDYLFISCVNFDGTDFVLLQKGKEKNYFNITIY